MDTPQPIRFARLQKRSGYLASIIHGVLTGHGWEKYVVPPFSATRIGARKVPPSLVLRADKVIE
jgi:hypothetical protein